jgi:hypothetical protein
VDLRSTRREREGEGEGGRRRESEVYRTLGVPARQAVSRRFWEIES